MFFEILSSAVMGSVVLYGQLKQGKNDAAKLQKIFKNAGLVVYESGPDKTKVQRNAQLYRRKKHEWGTEYVYRIPLGLSFKDFEKKMDHLQDGLNNKKNVLNITFKDLKHLDFKNNLIEQVKDLLNNKKRIQKEIELSYDGMLHVNVFDQPLPEFIDSIPESKGWSIPVGMDRKKWVKHDFEKIAHMIVAGMTRYGKSVFLKHLITTLIVRRSKTVKFTLIDLKGGLAFNRFKNLSQVDSVAHNIETAYETLKKVHDAIKEREKQFSENGWEDVNEANIKDRHFVVIDEAAEFSSYGLPAGEIKTKCQEIERYCAEIARIGAGLGYRLVFCTQYPTADTLPRQIKQNTGAKLCFKLQTSTASMVVLDEPGAESLPFIKGRAIYQTDRKHIIQTPFIDNETIREKIKPHITLKAREEDAAAANEDPERRIPTLVLEETGLS
jgi:hypothetical protein